MREPVGVVAVLCAFNFPLPGIAQKTAPALVAGCTAVVKVPDPDPLAIFAMADLVSQAGFPPGVLNIVATDAEGSAHLVSHPDVDMVTFTGSTEVGKKIGATCAEQVKPSCSSSAASRRRSSSRTPTWTPSLPMVAGYQRRSRARARAACA